MINVVVYPYQITSRLTPGSYIIIVVEPQPHMEMLESKWNTASVKYFFDHYAEASNKEKFLSNERWKTLFDQHIENHIVENIMESNVGYLNCTGNIEK